MENWELIMSTKNSARAELTRALLEQNELKAVILNKKDSNYPMFGFFEVYVPNDEAEAAKNIMANEISPE
jgi:hypothetical protein